MPLTSLPPLDLQTERLEQCQYPSSRMLLVVAAIAAGGLFLSWASHREAFAQRDQAMGARHEAPAAARHDHEGQVIASRALPLRK